MAKAKNLLEGWSPEVEVAKQLRKTTRTLRAWRAQGIGPAWVAMGNTIIYRDAGIPAWLESQEQKPGRSRRTA
jgi:hypothetical protein